MHDSLRLITSYGGSPIFFANSMHRGITPFRPEIFYDANEIIDPTIGRNLRATRETNQSGKRLEGRFQSQLLINRECTHCHICPQLERNGYGKPRVTARAMHRDRSKWLQVRACYDSTVVKINRLQQPSLIVVTGPPGSGKTTLAHSLAKAVRCPAICRDEIKEGLVNTIGELREPSQDIQGQAYQAFFDVIELLLKYRVTLIAEAAFQHERWAQRLEPMKPLAHIRMIVCTIDPQLAQARNRRRSLADPDRERFHGRGPALAAEVGSGAPTQVYDPPRLGLPILEVDTTDGYKPAFESIVCFARLPEDPGLNRPQTS